MDPCLPWVFTLGWSREEKLSYILRLRKLLGKSPRTPWEEQKGQARKNQESGTLRVEPVSVLHREKSKEAELNTPREALQTPESPRN